MIVSRKPFLNEEKADCVCAIMFGKLPGADCPICGNRLYLDTREFAVGAHPDDSKVISDQWVIRVYCPFGDHSESLHARVSFDPISIDVGLT